MAPISSLLTTSGSSSAARERRLIKKDLAAHDLVDPGLVHMQLRAASSARSIDVAAGDKEGRRALQHRHVGAIVRQWPG